MRDRLPAMVDKRLKIVTVRQFVSGETVVILTIANVSSSVDDPSFAAAVAAIGLQVSRDFQPEWNVVATISGTKLSMTGPQVALDTPTDAIIYLGDSSEDPTTGVSNVYGYHFANYNHIPYGFVYLDVCKQYGEVWSCTLSHEVLELLADPTASQTVSGPASANQPASGPNVYYDLEVCDPTQGDNYSINGVTVSNFVMKSYFNMLGGSANTNFLNLALTRFGTRPGGYFQYEDSGSAHQVNGSQVDAQRIAARAILGRYRRNARRAARLTSHHVLSRQASETIPPTKT
jgi:hypothetical protein